MAATPLPQQAIAERTEIHKSCRALETVVNILNDYSEAARAIVTLQKKLAKALRDAAACKATGDIASAQSTATRGVQLNLMSDRQCIRFKCEHVRRAV